MILKVIKVFAQTQFIIFPFSISLLILNVNTETEYSIPGALTARS